MPTASSRAFARPLLWVATLAAAACGSAPDPYSGLDVEALFATAEAEYAEGSYENAAEALDRLLLSFGDWDRLPEARLLLADSRFGAGEYLTSRADYVRFLDRHSGHGDASKAALGVCRSLAALAPDVPRDQSYTRDAILTCRNTVLDYPGTPEAAEAAGVANEMRLKLAAKEYQTADFYFRRGVWASAILYYESTVALYSETAFAPLALVGLYHANLAMGYDDEADEARDRLLRDYPDSDSATELRDNGGESGGGGSGGGSVPDPARGTGSPGDAQSQGALAHASSR